MRSILFLIVLIAHQLSFAGAPLSPEDHFVQGTNLLKPNLQGFDPEKGLEYMLLSAEKKYEHAPFGLCVALSIEKRILDLEHSYAWCYVASKIGNKYSDQANRHLEDIGSRIQEKGGEEAINRAKVRAKKTYGM